jgi:hypothetical protein
VGSILLSVRRTANSLVCSRLHPIFFPASAPSQSSPVTVEPSATAQSEIASGSLHALLGGHGGYISKAPGALFSVLSLRGFGFGGPWEAVGLYARGASVRWKGIRRTNSRNRGELQAESLLLVRWRLWRVRAHTADAQVEQAHPWARMAGKLATGPQISQRICARARESRVSGEWNPHGIDTVRLCWAIVEMGHGVQIQPKKLIGLIFSFSFLFLFSFPCFSDFYFFKFNSNSSLNSNFLYSQIKHLH